MKYKILRKKLKKWKFAHYFIDHKSFHGWSLCWLAYFGTKGKIENNGKMCRNCTLAHTNRYPKSKIKVWAELDEILFGD